MEIIGLKLGEARSNTYVVSENKQCFIIDPGYEGPEIIEYIKSRKLVPQFIYITHGHYDHTGGVKQLKELYHIPVYAPLKDKVWLTDTVYNHYSYDIPVDQYVVDGDQIDFGKHVLLSLKLLVIRQVLLHYIMLLIYLVVILCLQTPLEQHTFHLVITRL